MRTQRAVRAMSFWQARCHCSPPPQRHACALDFATCAGAARSRRRRAGADKLICAAMMPAPLCCSSGKAARFLYAMLLCAILMVTGDARRRANQLPAFSPARRPSDGLFAAIVCVTLPKKAERVLPRPRPCLFAAISLAMSPCLHCYAERFAHSHAAPPSATLAEMPVRCRFSSL